MLESRWMECRRPAPMLRYVANRASPRKLRLFACACIRRTWPWLRAEASRQAVEELERQADDRKTLTPTRAVRERSRAGAEDAEDARLSAEDARQEAEQHRAQVWDSVWVGDPPEPSVLVRSAALALEANAADLDAEAAAQAAELVAALAQESRTAAQIAEGAERVVVTGRQAVLTSAWAARWTHRADQEADRPVARSRAAVRASQARQWIEMQQDAMQERLRRAEERTARQERRAQCALLRDLFGHLFHPAAVEPAWLEWNGGCIAAMARTIYDDRKYQDLPILADALEEAGCTMPDLLDHCRQPGEHVRGCWVIDAILGKD
jgi:hypothetical protein